MNRWQEKKIGKQNKKNLAQIPLANKIKSALNKVKFIFKNLVLCIHTGLRR